MAKHLLKLAEIDTNRSEGAHPWNPNSHFLKSPLSRALGLERAIVVHMILPPGKESFVPHTHEREEEWIYVLSGTGTAEIDGQEMTVSAGDFMGFTAPSVVHHLRNTGTEDLVYLMGGECRFAEVSDFPTQGWRKVRFGDDIRVYDIEAGHS